MLIEKLSVKLCHDTAAGLLALGLVLGASRAALDLGGPVKVGKL